MEALAGHNIRFERHQEYYDRGTTDDVWLPFVGRNGWIVLTKDKRNRYNQWEKLAVQKFAVREFYFGSGNFTGKEMAESLVLALPELKRAYYAYAPPLVISIARSGAVTIVFDEHGSTHERRKAARIKSTE